MIRILFLIVFMTSFFSWTQKKIEISLEGYVNNFSSKEKLFGASIYMFQEGTMVSKSLSDVNGNYFIGGRINTKVPFDLMISKPGFVTKKVLLDFQDLKVQNPNGVLQAMEELIIELFEIKEGVDLSFVKNTYAEKFNWDNSRNLAVPEAKYKKDIEDKVLLAYSAMSDMNRAESFKNQMIKALKTGDFDKALIFVDSALFYHKDDQGLIKRKAQIEASIEKRANDIQKREEFENLKKQGDAAYSSGDFEGAEVFYIDASKLFSDNQIKYKLSKISQYKEKISKLESNKEKIEKLRYKADSLIVIEDFDGAISKLREIQFLDPNERTSLQTEIKGIEKNKKNSNYEQSIIKFIAVAERLGKSKDSLDASLLLYERVEKLIENLTDQALIQTYKSQVQQGIEIVSQSKSQEREAFNQQLEKANNNYLKGPDFYDKALKILDSDLMKPYKNEPEVKRLKDRIAVMGEFYKLKTSAYNMSSTNKKEAVIELKKALKVANDNYRLTPREEIAEVRDSINSWSGSSNFVNNSTTQPTAGDKSIMSSTVRSPGTPADSDLSAYNDLAITMNRKKNDPLNDLQKIKDEIDYEAYFDRTVAQVRNEKSAQEMQSYMEKLEIKNRAVGMQKLELQSEQDEERQRLEFSIKDRNELALFQQEASAKQIEEWRDQRDYLVELELLNQARRNQFYNEENRFHESERLMIAKQNVYDNEQRLYARQENNLSIERQRFVQDSIAKLGGENRANDLERLKSYKPDNTTQPNFLKDEEGVLFPPNAVTERVFKSENSMGFVTAVTVQRVVVDANGHGVVYEKTTNESGSTYFKRNGASITEYIWFNESMGQNVIED